MTAWLKLLGIYGLLYNEKTGKLETETIHDRISHIHEQLIENSAKIANIEKAVVDLEVSVGHDLSAIELKERVLSVCEILRDALCESEDLIEEGEIPKSEGVLAVPESEFDPGDIDTIEELAQFLNPQTGWNDLEASSAMAQVD